MVSRGLNGEMEAQRHEQGHRAGSIKWRCPYGQEDLGDNGRGGRYRAASGSAMYCVWLARGHEGMREPTVGATADGRGAGSAVFEFREKGLLGVHEEKTRVDNPI